ncbi:MAG: hypothetical protein P8O86_12830 [Actinomycetota bacterium]|nr:hypothetical protein [Actinomycetota bacterium]MDG2119880.1 hypothetical protein [Actinomycetota bacterium]
MLLPFSFRHAAVGMLHATGKGIGDIKVQLAENSIALDLQARIKGLET